jgi:hypothetical protein
MIGLMMVCISQDVPQSSPIMFAIVEMHSRILSRWEEELPLEMQWSEHTKESGTVFSEPHRISLVLLHIMFFGAQMLLRRRLLVAIAECQSKKLWTLDGSLEQGAQVHQECVEEAENCVHLLHVLGCTGHMFRRLWLCM